ncbi:F-box/kelch-repeat protein [Raphanus sativus]|nr:F-box/kelch-repeat protein [Raphanus sativus]
MKGRSAIRGCSGKKKKVSGLMSLPDDVFVDCLAQLSRLDLVALSMVSRRHRYLAGSRKLWSMRYRMDRVEPYVYVFMHMYPDPNPRWFVFHPVQRRLKRIHPSLCPAAPLEGSCFVRTESGIYTIGGLVDGKPTSEVTFLDCIDHTVHRVAPMKMGRIKRYMCLEGAGMLLIPPQTQTG